MHAEPGKFFTMQQIVLMVRDSRTTKGAQRQLLIALAIRANAKAKYSCFPSYAQLADDTQLDEVTLRRAAAALESKGLIKRRRRINRSNLFFLQVPVLAGHAAQARNEREQEKKARLLAAVEAGIADEEQLECVLADDNQQELDALALILGGGR